MALRAPNEEDAHATRFASAVANEIQQSQPLSRRIDASSTTEQSLQGTRVSQPLPPFAAAPVGR